MTTAKANLTGNLVRKQFLMSYSQIDKLLALSAAKGKSEAEIVRLAIDAYDPEAVGTGSIPELLELLDSRLKNAIRSTQKSNSVVANTLKKLGQKD
jgi:hypothetical protein